jgi:hypothetical protein
MKKKCDAVIGRGDAVHGNSSIRCGQELERVTRVVGGQQTTVWGCRTHNPWMFTN